MSGIQLAALLPLFILLVLSLIFRKVGVMHLMTLAYSVILGFLAITGQWSVLFFAPVGGSILVSLLLFITAMAEGEWY